MANRPTSAATTCRNSAGRRNIAAHTDRTIS
jgi:hypothetical protein